ATTCGTIPAKRFPVRDVSPGESWRRPLLSSVNEAATRCKRRGSRQCRNSDVLPRDCSRLCNHEGMITCPEASRCARSAKHATTMFRPRGRSLITGVVMPKRRWAWTSSIAFKLEIAFAIIVALTGTAILVAILRLDELAQIVDRVTGENLPAVSASL